MQAVMLRQFGPPTVLAAEAVADPVPGLGQVLIRVVASSVTFVDTQIRAGKGPTTALRPELPIILGNGVGGVVIKVGDDVDRALVGCRVISTTGGQGGYGELVTVVAEDVIAVPQGLHLTDAVALLADGRTAIGLVRAAQPSAGEWVLVEAAGGGVGSLLVQLARRAGTRVIGAASSQAKRRLAERVGAEVTIDYTTPRWPDQVRSITGGAGLDLVFDGVGGEIGASALGLLRHGGRFSRFGMASGAMTAIPEDEATRRGIGVIGFGGVTERNSIRDLARAALAEAAAGRLIPTIGQTFPLSAAADAHAAIEARATVGKTLLIPPVGT